MLSNFKGTRLGARLITPGGEVEKTGNPVIIILRPTASGRDGEAG